VIARATLALLTIATAAFADAPRVVIAERDPELHHAVETALAPWHVEVVDGARGDAGRIVIWRDGGELVIEDRASGTSERHAVRPNDPVGDAATALSVKTLLRLETPAPVEPARPAPVEPSPSLRAMLGGGALLGSTSAARGELAAMVAPWDGAVRFGIAGMIASGASIDGAGFKGTWHLWGVAAAASYAVAWDAWEVAPMLEVGVARSTLEGVEGSAARTEHQTLPRLALGAVGLRRFGRFGIGVRAAFATTPGTDTYIKTNGVAAIFTAPASTVEVGLVVSCDLFGAAGH